MNSPSNSGSVAAPLISVITVSYNAMGALPSTLASLREQGQGPWEWVVVDGASKDQSADWLRQQQPDVFLSEPDGGIYDAMNKAVQLARGDWLFFLNAGDTFADTSTLRELAQVLSDGASIDVVYGDVLYFGVRGERRHRFHWLSRRRLVFGDLCHQAAFVRRELFQRFGLFDLSLRYNADFDWFIRVFRGGSRLLYVHRDIARFHDAGAHVVAHDATQRERNVVRARYASRPMWLAGHWALRVELKLRRLLGQEIS